VKAPLSRALLCALLACAGAARAEKADENKPTQIEANRMSSDETRRLNVFEGNVVLTKGTLLVRADKILVRQDAEGYQYATATGNPVRFRQRQDPKDGKEGGWMDGEALRIEIDNRKSTIELHDKARVTREGDEVAGDFIFVDQRSDYFSVSAGPDATGKPAAGGRVRAILQPKPPEEKK
jgi:lipopolysaccharide export system protein LptA